MAQPGESGQRCRTRRGRLGTRGPCPKIGYMTEVTPQAEELSQKAGPGALPADDVENTAVSASTNAVEVAEAWLAQLADRISVPASDVQDHLLDLWGALDEGPARSEVERWLTETLGRNLYSVSDINERLEVLLPVG